MRIKKISSDKIIVQLTDSDLEYFDLDIDRCRPQAADLHKLLFEVMELVKTETGFDPYNGGQVVVEAAMSQNGMSLTISKLRPENKKLSREEFAKVKRISTKSALTADDVRSIADGMRESRPKKSTSKKSVHIFNTYADFEAAVCVIAADGLKDAQLYRRGGRYALVYAAMPEHRVENLLSEYCVHTLHNDVAAYSIGESWVPVSEGEALVTMAENIRKMNYL